MYATVPIAAKYLPGYFIEEIANCSAQWFSTLFFLPRCISCLSARAAFASSQIQAVRIEKDRRRNRRERRLQAEDVIETRGDPSQKRFQLRDPTRWDFINFISPSILFPSSPDDKSPFRRDRRRHLRKRTAACLPFLSLCAACIVYYYLASSAHGLLLGSARFAAVLPSFWAASCFSASTEQPIHSISPHIHTIYIRTIYARSLR